MQHPGLLEAARKVHDCAVVVPNIVYANLLLPGQELAVHTDVPEFRGANRKLYPQWLMVVMLHSGLFAPWRRKIATGIAYFGRAQGGALAFYPDGREGPARTLEARHNTAIVLDTDTVFHGVDRVRETQPTPGAAAGHAPPLGGRPLARRSGGRAGGALPARRGALLGLVEGLLLPRRGRARAASTSTATISRSTGSSTTLKRDLAARGEAAPADETELARLLIDTYIHFPAATNGETS